MQFQRHTEFVLEQVFAIFEFESESNHAYHEPHL
jgi:hypothetical protein